MSLQHGVLWEGEHSRFIMSVSDPYHSGWYDVLIEIYGDEADAKEQAANVLKEAGFYRPHDNWRDWERVETTYMKTQAVYHQIKVRNDTKVKGDEEE